MRGWGEHGGEPFAVLEDPPHPGPCLAGNPKELLA